MKIYIKKNDIALLIFISFLGAISPLLISFSIANIGKIQTLTEIVDLKFLFLQSILFMFLSILSDFLYKYVSQQLLNKLWTKFRKDIIERIIVLNYKNFLEHDSNFYINLLTKKEDFIRDYYFGATIRMIKNIISLSSCFILIIIINPRLIIIFSIFLALLIINNYFFPKLIGEKYDEYMSSDIKLLTLVKELSAGFFTLKIFNAISNFKNKLFKNIDVVSYHHNKAIQLTNFSACIAFLIISLLEFTTVFYSGYLLINSKINLVSFLFILQLSSYVTNPVIEFINDHQMKQSIAPIIADFNISNIQTKKENIDKLNNIKIFNLNFSYNDSVNIFKSFSYQLELGKKYLLIGKSGCGKSTLLKLLTKQYDNYTGEILLNNKNMHDISEESVFRNISFVSQDVFLFNDTLENNIFLGKSHSEKDFTDILSRCKLNDLYIKHKYDNLTSDNINISGGEKSRIGLSRAIVSEKPFIFLDEVLSSLDSGTSKEIENLILSLKNKCVINICHKYNKENIQQYDFIINLDDCSK